MGEKEASGGELAKLYKGGATLAEIAAETGLGRFAVAYRLKVAGIERRNRGSERKTNEEKGAFALQQLAAIFGESLPEVMESLRTNAVTARDLAAQNNIKDSTFRTWLTRAGMETPKKKAVHRSYHKPPRVAAPGLSRAEKPVSEVAILDLVSPRDSQITRQILDIFSRQHLYPQEVAAASDRQLKIFGFTDEGIAHMRKRLKKRQTGS